MTANPTAFIGKYKVISEIAKGGMGTVYLAEHPSLKRQVIIKKLMLKLGTKPIRERFKREAQILLDLSSPNVLRMFDYFSEGRADYIVLEFIDGMSLDKLLEKQVSLPPAIALVILENSLRGLLAAHKKGIVHRDIKPGNILISKKAEIKLADFGIASEEKEKDIEMDKTSNAKLTVHAADSITQIGSTLGTPAYMSPEQLTDSSSVDGRADIYSMGVMLYEMVTGCKPYAGDMSRKTILKIKKGDYTPPEMINKGLPRVVKVLIKRMMKPNPAKRYQSVQPIIKRINRYLRNYDIHYIKVCLARSISTAKYVEYPEFVPKNRRKIKALIYITSIIAAINIAAFAWKSGFVHRFILFHWFTPVSLKMEMPSTASADADLPARAFFFVNKSDIPEVKNSRRIFQISKTSRKGKNIECYTKPVYLRPGEYRIKIAEGPYIWWKTILVENKKKVLELDFLKNVKRELQVHYTAIDQNTQKDITSSCRFKIQIGSKWVDVRKADMSKLKSGTIHKFLIACDGYYDEYFSLMIDWYQDELFINGSMKKKQD